MNTSFAVQLGHIFHNPELLETALTHRSFFFEHRGSASAHYERMEFLGDAVLDLILSEVLMKCFPQMNEGTLSKWRASLVNESVLAEVAREIDLGTWLRLGKSEEKERHNLRPRLLSSAFEAVVAALYLDGGLSVATAFVEKKFSSRIEKLDATNEFAADFKTRLQEKTQKKYHTVPEYKLKHSDGPEHAKNFVYEVFVNGFVVGIGSGNSRKSAEQEAARYALESEDLEARVEKIENQNVEVRNTEVQV